MTRRLTLASLLAASATLSAIVSAPPGASAATATTTTAPDGAKTAGFCAQLKLSQQTMGAIPAAATDRFARVATEWKKLESTAPSSIKGQVTLVRGAYEKAAKLKGAAATAALSAASKPAAVITDFAAKNCQTGRGPGGAGGGPGEGRFEEMRACLEKAGVALPRRDQGDGGAPPASVDPKVQKALEACGFAPGQGGQGGQGGPGGRGGGAARGLNNPELLACLKKAGVTIPSVAQGQRPQLDDKARAAVETCRQQLGLGGGAGAGARTRPGSTVKA